MRSCPLTELTRYKPVWARSETTSGASCRHQSRLHKFTMEYQQSAWESRSGVSICRARANRAR